jgi:apolipoprotein N-acyltransferase
MRKSPAYSLPAPLSEGLMPLLSGLLLGLAFPTWPALHLEPFAWIALVPLLFSLERDFSFGSFFRKVWMTTTLFCIISLWWVCLATFVGGVLSIFVQSFFSTVPFVLFYLIRKRAGYPFALLSLPFVWTGWEWAYMQQDLSFGWLTLGNSQANLLWMVQYADVTGVWGISFWLLVFNVLMVFLLKARSEGLGGRVTALSVMALFMIVAPLGYAWHVFAEPPPPDALPSVRVSLVQPDIDPHEKWGGIGIDETMARLVRLTGRELVNNRPDLVLWPETAIPFYIRNPENEPYMNVIRRMVDRWHTPLLTGFPDSEPVVRHLASTGADGGDSEPSTGRQFAAYNASMLLQPGQPAPQIYRKMRLVPFGERVPYSEYFPWLERLSFSLSGINSWQKGQDATVMTFRSTKGREVRVANIICYESIFPGLVSQFVRKGAQFLTLVTNDGWYGTSYGPWQHAAIGRLRCIENRRSMARCANTGVTLFYDRYGRSYAETAWWQSAVLTADIRPENDLSLYTRYPDLFPKLSLAVAGVLAVLGACKKRT